MTAPYVDSLPTPPTLDLPRETFDLAASPFFAAFNPFIAQFNATVQWFNEGNYDVQPAGHVVSDLATTTIPASIKAIRTGGYAGVGDGGAADWVEDEFADEALSIAHPRFCKETASGRFIRLDISKRLDIMQAGAAGDDDAWPLAEGSPTNDGPVFLAALAYMRAMLVAGAPNACKLTAPKRNFYMGTSTLDLTFTLTIEGVVGDINDAQTGNYGTRLRWANGVTGIRTQFYGTTGAYDEFTPTDGYYSNNSIIRNLYLWGGSYTAIAESESHGIHLRSPAVLENITVRQFSGDGVHAYASTTDVGGTHYGNANGSILRNIKVIYCRNGFYFNGADVNSILCEGCWTFLNHRYGRWHVKGLNLEIRGDLAESNGRHWYGTGSNYATTCHFGGSWYYCLPNQDTGAATNAPKGAVVTFDGTTNKVAWTAHGLSNGTIVTLRNSGGALPTGLADGYATGTQYYVVGAATNDFQLSATLGGAAIDFTGNGTGTTTLGVAAANTWWGWLSAGNGGTDVPTWSNGMQIKSGGAARFDGAGQNGFYNSYIEANQAPPQMESQIVTMNVSAVDFTGAAWGGSMSVVQNQLTFAGAVTADNLFTGLKGATFGSITADRDLNIYINTIGSPRAATISFQDPGGVKATIGVLGNDLYVGGYNGALLTHNGTIVAAWSTAGLLFRGASGKVGYGTGAGGAVTQATSRTTGVTLNKPCGQITLVSAAGSATWASFTVTNSVVEAGDVVQVSQKSGTDKYMLSVTAVGAGSFQISFATTGGTTTEQPVFSFAVIKAVAA